MDLSIIVPCYNEAENIPLLMDELLPILRDLPSHSGLAANNLEVIFVDDGSQDNTYPLLREVILDKSVSMMAFKLERHHGNQGLGAALRTGFSVADGEVIITVDSDGTYKYSEIPALLSFLTPDIDIVTASPYHPSGGVAGVPPSRLLLSRGSSLIYKRLLDSTIHTYTSLFRAYRSKVIRSVPFGSDGFLAGTELMVKAMLQGYQVAEFPTVLHRRQYGVSKAKIARTILAHLGFQGQLLLHRLHISNMIEPKPDQIGNLYDSTG